MRPKSRPLLQHERSLPFRDATLWPEYTAHAWKRGAHEHIHRGVEVSGVELDPTTC